MTMYYYSTSDSFAKGKQEDEEFTFEKSSEEFSSLTKHFDGLLHKFNEFLKSFPMTEQEVLLEKADKFYNNKYHFVKSTAKSLWYDRAVTRLSMDSNTPRELLYIVKCVIEKGGDYADYISPKTYKKAIKFFKVPEKTDKSFYSDSHVMRTDPDTWTKPKMNMPSKKPKTNKESPPPAPVAVKKAETIDKAKQQEFAGEKDKDGLTAAQRAIVNEQAKTPTPVGWTAPRAKTNRETSGPKPKSAFSKQRTYLRTKYDNPHRVGNS